jgi:hypothetical protein
MVTEPCSEQPRRRTRLVSRTPLPTRGRDPLVQQLKHNPSSGTSIAPHVVCTINCSALIPRPVLPRSVVSEVRCFDCGTAKMESFHTSTQGGYHLCPTCFQQRLRTGRARTAH